MTNSVGNRITEHWCKKEGVAREKNLQFSGLPAAGLSRREQRSCSSHVLTIF